MARRDNQQRIQIAQMAARLLLDAGNRDYATAKRKAAEKLGIRDRRCLPGNEEIEQALVEYLRIFQNGGQQEQVSKLRREALMAMRLLESFLPRLVGSVLSGTADKYSAVHLHVFSDDPEAIPLFLMRQAIPYDTGERRVRWGNGTIKMMPLYRFVAGETRIEVTAFPLTGLREPPLSPVDGRSMQRADLPAVERMVNAAENEMVSGY